MGDPALTEELAPEDLVLARSLLEGRTAEEVAGALVRLYRSRLPAPEELADPAAMPERRKPRSVEAREPRGPGHEGRTLGKARPAGPMRWFSLNVGRDQKADPKWLIPVICRLGGVTKREIEDDPHHADGDALRGGGGLCRPIRQFAGRCRPADYAGGGAGGFAGLCGKEEEVSPGWTEPVQPDPP